MDRKWIIAGFGVLAAGIVASHLINYKSKTSFSTATSDTPYAAQQDNFYPLGIKSTIATHAAAPVKNYGKDGLPDQGWEMGGTSSVTSSTGRWAQ
jgi:hypothetical protein